MGMIDTLRNIAPLTTQRFLAFMMNRYAVGESDVEEAPLADRYIEILRYFGYAAEIKKTETKQNIISRIKEIFTDYENLIKNPAIDIVDELLYLSPQERESKYKDLFKMPEQKKTLKDCLVSIIGLKKSFIDCLVPRIFSTDELEEQFWNKKVFEEFIPTYDIPF